MEYIARHVSVLSMMLAFDSAANPVKRGFRKMQDSSRHLLFENDDLCLDLRLEPDLENGTFAVHGQLADRRDPLKGRGGNPVLLLAGQRVEGWMFGNRNGEFVFEVKPGRGLLLCLPIAQRGQIEIPLDPLLSAGAGTTE
jgi:hypothetical protein